MKKTVIFCLILSMLLAFSGCNRETDNSEPAPDNSAQESKPIEYTDSFYHADAGVDYTKPIGYLYKDGATSYHVVIPAEATATETYAAQEFQIWFRELTGVDISIVSDADETFDTENKVISIGKTVYQKNVDLSGVDYSELKTDGFITKSFGNVYILDSGSKDGLIYSAYNFLEIFFGLEFMTNEYTYIPKIGEEVVAYKTDITDIPAFAVRDYYAYSAFYEGVTYGTRMRNNSSVYAQDSIRDKSYYFGYYCNYNGNSSWFPQRMGHTITALLSADAYVNGVNSHLVTSSNPDSPNFKSDANGASKNWNLGYYNAHPDWYAQDTNTRYNANNDSQEEVCYSNGLTEDGEYDPTQTDSLVNKMIDICKIMILDPRNDESTALMLGHGDYEAKCQCEKCKKFYEKFGGFSGATCVWMNAIVKEVKVWMQEQGIDRKISFVMFAYSKSITPPGTYNEDGTFTPISNKVILDDDIAVQMAWRNCTYHDLWDMDCVQNEDKRKEFSAWSTLAKSMEIWDYDAIYSNYLWYMPNSQVLSEQYKYYTTIGVNRVLTQGAPSANKYYQYHLKQWLSLKLLWNPNQDVCELIKDFNNKFFTERYAVYVNKYLDVMNNHLAILDATKENGIHLGTYNLMDTLSGDVFDYKLLNAAIDIIYEGIEEVESDNTLSSEDKARISKHLRSVAVTPQYMVLKLGYIVDATELKEFATEFFYNADLLGLESLCEGNFEKISVWKKAFGL